MGYPRYVTKNWKPFNPVELAKKTEKVICRGNKRKYTDFYAVGVYGGIATGYTVGCCLRCVFCWVDWSRDFPEKLGEFYSPQEAFENLSRAAKGAGVQKMRISGAEPTLGKAHLLSLLEKVENSEIIVFVLETNGVIFGIDKGYVEKVSRFEKVHVRLSIKAGTPEDFQNKTGAAKEFFDIPFKGIENLLDCGASFHVAAMSADPRFMRQEERESLIKKLWHIDKSLVYELEEEVVDPYQTTLRRLEFAGMDVKFPLKKRYAPVRFLLQEPK